MDSKLSDTMNDSKNGAKAPVVRGARACTVCRAAKMKCVGAEDGGQKPCQRCKRANTACIFEKHRRGRKPGSKLSEASKMLRRLERGLNSAKQKSQASDAGASSSYQIADPRAYQDLANSRTQPGETSYGSHLPPREPTPSTVKLNNYHSPGGVAYRNDSRTMGMDDDEGSDHEIFPEELIHRANQRNSFFSTILNPNPEEPYTENRAPNPTSIHTPKQNPHLSNTSTSALGDPITAGILREDDADVLFDLIFLRLNPYINLFDAELHTVAYVRTKCPFLFTALLMAGSKFFKPECFKQCQRLANEFAIRAFAEGWKRVEVVQAFACLTYWKEPHDKRTWTYIGYACRMAIELRLNTYVAQPPANETPLQKLERRNRERTYLVLFVHDRSLSTQTGRDWMLPEGELVRNSSTWHEQGLAPTRPEDVIVAAFVALRLIVAEATDVLHAARRSSPSSRNDSNHDTALRTALRQCDAKLTQWDGKWRCEMERANGQQFHFAFLKYFLLYVTVFLNGFEIQASKLSGNRRPLSVHVLTACYTSAMESLRIISNIFARNLVLGYAQESITVMSAYSAVFLLKLLESPVTSHQLTEETALEIRSLISTTADAYETASSSAHPQQSTEYHARFFRSLLLASKARNEQRESGISIDRRLQRNNTGSTNTHGVQSSSSPTHLSEKAEHEQSFHFPASPHLPAHPIPHEREYHATDITMRNSMTTEAASMGQVHHHQNGYPIVQHQTSELDAHYWKHMFRELGFGENGDPSLPSTALGTSDARNMQYMPHEHVQHHHPHQGQIAYHIAPSNYGH